MLITLRILIPHSGKTCRRLAEISRARPVWAVLFRNASSFLSPPPKLERPIEEYTSYELEQTLLTSVKADIGWRSDCKPMRRDILIKELRHDTIVLVEGGRWLLTVSDHAFGYVYAYDLDADPIQDPKVIIQPEGEWDAQKIYYMSIDVDRQASTLTFNLALFPALYFSGMTVSHPCGRIQDMPIPRLRIYRVAVVGRGIEASLVPQQLASLPIPSTGFTYGLSLLGQYASRRFFTSAGDNDRIEVYDWASSNASQHVKTFLFYRRKPVRADVHSRLRPFDIFIAFRRRSCSYQETCWYASGVLESQSILSQT